MKRKIVGFRFDGSSSSTTMLRVVEDREEGFSSTDTSHADHREKLRCAADRCDRSVENHLEWKSEANEISTMNWRTRAMGNT